MSENELQIIESDEKAITQFLGKVIRTALENACKAFTDGIDHLGFIRTKKLIWVRQREITADFIQFHRCGSTYGKARNYSVEIRVHFGIRVLNDTFSGLALTGPFSDSARTREGRYHLRFNAKTGSTYERCVEDLVRFVNEQGEPWFQKFEDASHLLEFADSPLIKQEMKDSLAAALSGKSNTENVSASLKKLGIKAK